MKVVLEAATKNGESGYYPRDVEIVGVRFCEFDTAGWVSVWLPDADPDDMPYDAWLIEADTGMDLIRVWTTKDDIVADNWVYSCRRVSIMGDD